MSSMNFQDCPKFGPVLSWSCITICRSECFSQYSIIHTLIGLLKKKMMLVPKLGQSKNLVMYVLVQNKLLCLGTHDVYLKFLLLSINVIIIQFKIKNVSSNSSTAD